MKRLMLCMAGLMALCLVPAIAAADAAEDFGRCYQALSNQEYPRCIVYCSVIADNEDLDAQLRSMALSNRGICHEFNSDLRRALEDQGNAIELYPGNASAYANRAFLHVKTGELGKSKADASKARELDPTCRIPEM